MYPFLDHSQGCANSVSKPKIKQIKLLDKDYKTPMGKWWKSSKTVILLSALQTETGVCYLHYSEAALSLRGLFFTFLFFALRLTTQCRKPPQLALNRVPWITQCPTIQIVTVMMQITIFHCSHLLISLEMLFNSHMLSPSVQTHQTKMSTRNQTIFLLPTSSPLRAGRKTML